MTGFSPTPASRGSPARASPATHPQPLRPNARCQAQESSRTHNPDDRHHLAIDGRAHDGAGRRVRPRRTWVGRQRHDRGRGTCGASAPARTTPQLRRDHPVRRCGARVLERGKCPPARRSASHPPPRRTTLPDGSAWSTPTATRSRAASPGTTVPAHDGIHQPSRLRDVPDDRRGPPPAPEPARVMAYREVGIQHDPVHAVVAARQQIPVPLSEAIGHPPTAGPCCTSRQPHCREGATPSGRSPGRRVAALAAVVGPEAGLDGHTALAWLTEFASGD